MIKLSCLRFFFLTIFLSASLLTFTVNSKEKFVVVESYPYTFINDKGQRDGFMIEFVETLAVESGVELNPVALPARRLVRALEKGRFKYALALGGRAVVGRTRILAEGPCVESFLLQKKGEEIGEGSQIGAVRGILSILLKRKYPEFRVLEVGDHRGLMEMFLKGRLDGIAILSGAYGMIKHELENTNNSKAVELIKTLDEPILIDQAPLLLVGPATHVGGGILENKVKVAFSEMKNNIRFQELYKKYHLPLDRCG
jgi:ABC-type amino acid transport substrate-binding protein